MTGLSYLEVEEPRPFLDLVYFDFWEGYGPYGALVSLSLEKEGIMRRLHIYENNAHLEKDLICSNFLILGIFSKKGMKLRRFKNNFKICKILK